MSSFEPLTINQTYIEPPVYDLVNPSIGCIAFLVVMFAIFSLYCIFYQLCFYDPSIPSIPVTVIEAMGELINNLPEETESLVKLILCDFCGYQSFVFQHHKSCTEELMRLKQKFKNHQIHPIHRSAMFFSYGNLTLFILIASLLFATYCGVVFLVQNDQYIQRYSIPFKCKVDEYDTCIVRKDAVIWWKEVDDDDGYVYRAAKYKYSDYTNFYNDTFEPYLQRIGDVEAMKRFESNPVLRISFKTQDVSVYPDEYNSNTNSYERVRMGYLYLSENGLSDSDVILSQKDDTCDCDCDDCDCCCCGKVCSQIIRGESDCCGEGKECYCDRAQVWDSETKELVINQGTCCECCCASCGGVPCHCTCLPCWQCCVGCIVFITMWFILFFLFSYFMDFMDDDLYSLQIKSNSYSLMVGGIDSSLKKKMYLSGVHVLESIIQEIKALDYKFNDWTL